MAHRSVQGRAGTRVAIGIGSLLVVAAVVMGCGSSASNALSTVGGPVTGQPAEAPAAMPSAAALSTRDGTFGAANGGATTTGGTDVTTPDGSGPLIVRTGQLDLQVADIEAAIHAAETAVTAVGGYVAGSLRSGDADKATASVTFRVPAARWSETLDALRKLGNKVLCEQTACHYV
jgi:hypothetical protein